MNEPTTNEVQHLANVIADAKLHGISAGAYTLARRILAAGYRHVDPDERHVIDLRDGGWTISHPLACRVTGLFECEVNRAAERDLTEPPAEAPGRYECGTTDGRFAIGRPAAR